MNEIFSIAQGARRWVEQKANTHGNKKDIRLTGWCAIASGYLFRQLANAGIESEIHLHENNNFCHAFIVTNDHVVDVTATQFSEFRHIPVVILHTKEAEQYEFYQTNEIFVYPDQLRRYQHKNGWPSKQIVLNR